MADGSTAFHIPHPSECPCPEVLIGKLRARGLDYFAHAVPREFDAWRYSLDQYKQEVLAQVAAWIDFANWHYGLQGTAAIPLPVIGFNLRGKTAGMVRYHRRGPNPIVRDLRINIDLLERFPKKIIGETVPHEVAHIVARHIHPGRNFRPHGKEWKAVMQDMGQQPRRCHTLHTFPARMRRVWKPMWRIRFDNEFTTLCDYSFTSSLAQGDKVITLLDFTHWEIEPIPVWRCEIE